jgi:NAD-dependent DNA ligase
MRNLVAGCVSSNVPKKVAEQIIFVAYEIPSHSGQMKLSEQLRLMKTTVTHTIVRASLVTYDSILTTYKDRKTNGEFDIDGIVVAMDITYALESGSNPTLSLSRTSPWWRQRTSKSNASHGTCHATDV